MRKLIMIAVALTMIPLVSYAQPAAQQPQEYTIKLTTAEIDIVGKALGTLPYQEVALIIQKLRQQIVDQQSANKPDEKK